MSGDVQLCEHYHDANNCEECVAEGEAYRQSIRSGEKSCPICGKNCTKEIIAAYTKGWNAGRQNLVGHIAKETAKDKQ